MLYSAGVHLIAVGKYVQKIVLPYNNFPYPNSLLQDSGPGLRVVSGRAVAC
uniref:HlyR sequence enhancing hemolysin expression n=1 Tax=Escherichia coli TaxID=562 RepID=Q47263_ECOLX|nr:unnamed protein product [Escherichia coli]